MFPTNTQIGFTLIEIIAVLIIFSILAAVAVPRYAQLEEDANHCAIDAAVSEVRIKPTLTGHTVFWMKTTMGCTMSRNESLNIWRSANWCRSAV